MTRLCQQEQSFIGDKPWSVLENGHNPGEPEWGAVVGSGQGGQEVLSCRVPLMAAEHNWELPGYFCLVFPEDFFFRELFRRCAVRLAGTLWSAVTCRRVERIGFFQGDLHPVPFSYTSLLLYWTFFFPPLPSFAKFYSCWKTDWFFCQFLIPMLCWKSCLNTHLPLGTLQCQT